MTFIAKIVPRTTPKLFPTPRAHFHSTTPKMTLILESSIVAANEAYAAKFTAEDVNLQLPPAKEVAVGSSIPVDTVISERELITLAII